ncbi:MAG: T9SS type A sorting domain-containing protein [Ignavibacteriales bacterium]|nr:T9SS type A sorting domain-containing protein [Ignavibacteriales bacterium]
MKNFLILFILFQLSIIAQTDETKYQWPTPSFNASRGLTATFGEFRNTGSSDHFHNAVDIGEPDDNPVYPSIDGVVHYFSNNGYDSYINVKSIINGKKKHLTYYHVVPNPSLYVNQVVKKGETIIGTIYNGAAHVHLIEREFMDISSTSLGNEINPVRPEGGLDPYYDSYPPVINESNLKFYEDGTSNQIPNNQLIGKVDIRIDVREKNGTSSSNVNNGTYILGYRVLSESGSEIIYEPKDNGVKYRFYYIPNDNYVHNVFVKNVATLSDPIYWLTNGNGEKQINENLTVSNNYLDTDLFSKGNYQLEIFSEDTRSNKSSKRFPITVAKLPPELNTVVVKDNKIKISWTPYKLNNLLGYRIYYSDDGTLGNWKLAANEESLKSEMDSVIFNNPNDFYEPSNQNAFYFYLTARDSLNNESDQSDIYSVSYYTGNSPNYLIVDGFDRYGGIGSWKEPQHFFNTFYFDAINNTVNYNISSCSNEAVMNEEVDLKDYDMVVWFLGDESLQDNTLTNPEQYKLALYLENGGKLFITGEDIGQDLDTEHSKSESSDTLFYYHYLKAKLMHDGLDLLNEINGEVGTMFNGININFGEVYPSDAPDDIEPINGSQTIFNYNYDYERDGTYRKGGIAYTGNFGESTKTGSLVYFSFPFETIGDKNSRDNLMLTILWYFGIIIIDVDDNLDPINDKFELSQNYPNPFNPTTTIKYSVPSNMKSKKAEVKLVVYDVLGREVKTLVNHAQKPGNYQIDFNANNLPSGVYYYQFKAGSFIQTKKMVLLK